MPSARVSRCEKLCFSLSICNLQLLNLIDFGVGGSFIGYAVYLYHMLGYDDFSNVNTAWIGWCSGSLGILLVLQSLLSFIAIVTPGCRWASIPSYLLTVLSILYCLALGIISVVKKDDFFNYLNTNGNSNGLSDNAINSIETWYTAIIIIFFVLFVLQIVRFRLLISYRTSALRLDNEFVALLNEDNKQWNDKISANKVERQGKYNNLRNHYKEKYKKDNTEV